MSADGESREQRVAKELKDLANCGLKPSRAPGWLARATSFVAELERIDRTTATYDSARQFLLDVTSTFGAEMARGLAALYCLEKRFWVFGSGDRRKTAATEIYGTGMSGPTFRDRHERRVHETVAEAICARASLAGRKERQFRAELRQSIDWSRVFAQLLPISQTAWHFVFVADGHGLPRIWSTGIVTQPSALDRNGGADTIRDLAWRLHGFAKLLVLIADYEFSPFPFILPRPEDEKPLQLLMHSFARHPRFSYEFQSALIGLYRQSVAVAMAHSEEHRLFCDSIVEGADTTYQEVVETWRSVETRKWPTQTTRIDFILRWIHQLIDRNVYANSEFIDLDCIDIIQYMYSKYPKPYEWPPRPVAEGGDGQSEL